MSDLETLVAVSQYAGRDVLLTQGGGGNASVKSADGRSLWIKASGLRLRNVSRQSGYVQLDLAELQAIVRDSTLRPLPPAAAHAAAAARVQAARRGAGQLRPSLETTFHAVLSRIVLHTHPVYVNAFTCAEDGREALANLLGLEPVWVPYATPGYALGVAVDCAVEAHRRAGGPADAPILLANHGLIVHGREPAQVIQTTERLVAAGQRHFGLLPANACDSVEAEPGLRAWAEGLALAWQRRDRTSLGGPVVRPAHFAILHQAAAEADQWLAAGPLVPDDVVYGGRQVFVAEVNSAPADCLEVVLRFEPQIRQLIVAVRGRGVVLAGPTAAYLDTLEENLLAHVLVRRLIARRGRPRTLQGDAIDALLTMESETYRQDVAARYPRTGT